MILLASIFFIAACNGDDTENSNGDNNENEQTAEDDEGNSEENSVYQIGETASTESSSYGFPYEVTVNSMELTEEVEGRALAEFYAESSEPSEDARFAVINVTLANTGDEGFIPNSTMTPTLIGDLTSESPEVNAMSVFDEEIPAGEEVTADLVYITDTLFEENGMIDLFFNIHDPNLEIKFELPIP